MDTNDTGRRETQRVCYPGSLSMSKGSEDNQLPQLVPS